MKCVLSVAMLLMPALALAQAPPEPSREQLQAQLQVTWNELQESVAKVISARADNALMMKQVESLKKQIDDLKKSDAAVKAP